MAGPCSAVSGQTGTCEVFRYACPRLTLFAPSRSRALRKFPDGNFRRPLVGILRAFTSAEMAALRCNAAARIGFLLAALHSVAKRVSHGQAYHPMRSVPVCPQTAPHASAATVGSSVPDCRAIARVSPRVERIARLGVLVLAEPWEPCTLLPASGKWGRAALASTRGPCGAGGRAFRGLTRSATEWSAARRKPLRAAAIASQRSHFCRSQARRLPTSERQERKWGHSSFPKQKGTDLQQVCPLLPAKRGNEECPHILS